MADGTTPLEQAYRAYEQLEGQLSGALDQLVATNGFADLLATSATNVMALTRMVNGTVDRVVRSTRLAARQDVTELARQLGRTEDKLERLLQAVETLQASLDSAEKEPPPGDQDGPKSVSEQTPKSSSGGGTVPSANGRVSRARATAGRTRRPAGPEPS